MLQGIIVDVARDPKKFTAVIHYHDRPRTKRVEFGLKSRQDPDNDYPHHRDFERMLQYLRRHGASLFPRTPRTEAEAASRLTTSTKEDWTARTGVTTAGFWSRWFLWSFTNLSDVIRHIEALIDAPVHVTPRAQAAFTDENTHTHMILL